MKTTSIQTPKGLLEAEIIIHARRKKLQNDYGEQETAATEKIGTGCDPSAIISRLSSMKVEIDLMGKTVADLRQRRLDEIERVRLAGVEDSRAQAAELKAKAASLYAACDKPLRQLSEILGVTFTRDILTTQIAGGRYAHPGAPDVPLEFLSPGEFVAHPDLRFVPNNAQILMRQSAKLEAKAGMQSIEPVCDQGQAEGTDYDSVMKQITSDPMRVIPAFDSIDAWFAALDDRINATAPTLAGEPRSYTLMWKNGEITESSVVYIGGHARFTATETHLRSTEPSPYLTPRERVSA